MPQLTTLMFIKHFRLVTPDVEIDDGIRFSVYAYFCSGVGSRGGRYPPTELILFTLSSFI